MNVNLNQDFNKYIILYIGILRYIILLFICKNTYYDKLQFRLIYICQYYKTFSKLTIIKKKIEIFNLKKK